MQKIKLRSHVGEDGILHLDIPSGFKGIEVQVTVTVEPIEKQNESLEDLSQLEWHEFIEKTYGCLADDPIIRYPQGKYPEREPIE
ncbi:MAG: hypothetical protein AB4426_09955 [Xenococcaceae cyanobacterium]